MALITSLRKRLPRHETQVLRAPAVTANATSAVAPASVVLTATAGLHNYLWSPVDCPQAVDLNYAPWGMFYPTLILTSGPGLPAVFSLAGEASGRLNCSFQMRALDGMGGQATSIPISVMVSCARRSGACCRLLLPTRTMRRGWSPLHNLVWAYLTTPALLFASAYSSPSPR